MSSRKFDIAHVAASGRMPTWLVQAVAHEHFRCCKTCDVSSSRWLALVVVVIVCAACSPSGTPQTSPTSHLTSSGPIGCLDPRVPAKPPAGGWLPDTTGVSDYEPENAGVEQSPSAQASLFATRVRSDLGHGLSISSVSEFATAGCVVDRDVVLDDRAGDVAFVRVLQLHKPLNDGSFPLVGRSISRDQLTNGAVLLTAHAEDNSLVTAVLVRTDGLLVELQVRSRTGQDTSGWPTTFGTPPPAKFPVASPVAVAQASIVIQKIAELSATAT